MPAVRRRRRFTSASRPARSRHPAVASAAPESLERRVLMAVDFGDAPASYGTLLADEGARHTIVAGFRLGERIDGENNGIPTANADGDDLSPPNPGGTGDDEDGVFLPGTGAAGGPYLGKGAVNRVTLQASAPGVVDAFIDYNRDGDFDERGEKVVDNVAVDGFLEFFIRVPADAGTGLTYARFRLSTAGGLGPTGEAADGEVEDYRVSLADLDWGDAPDSYGTTSVSNGAASVVGAVFLGQRVDAEPDGQPDDAALGDDANPATAPDDEDGVVIPRLVQGRGASFRATLSSIGYIVGYLDVNGNGDFDANQFLNETIPYYPSRFGQPLQAGAHDGFIGVPDTAPVGVAYARFRADAQVDASNANPVFNRGFRGTVGEVEDYRVVIERGFDWGDAPDSYGTTVGADGARHGLGSGLRLGDSFDPFDSEDSGTPTLDAKGDDFGNDEEDGINFGRLDRGAASTITAFATRSGARLDAFFDFNRDGDFADAGEKVINAGVITSPSGTDFTFNIPAAARTGPTYARFRISAAGGLGPTGEAPDGEVEDYRVAIVEGADFGDLPTTYPTLLADDGARHRLGGTLYLGTAIDAELDGAPGPAAVGDDLSNADDEDGVSLPALVRGGTGRATVTANGSNGRLDGFIDFNRDGDFADAGERIFNNVALSHGPNPLSFNVPLGAAAGQVYARFRVSSAGNLGPAGEAPDGEVEDYTAQVRSAPPVITLPGPSVAQTAGGPAVVIDPTATVADPDNTNFPLGQLTVELVNGTGTPDDRIEIRNEGSGPGQVGVNGNEVTFGGVMVGTSTGGSGGSVFTVTFNGQATLPAVQAVLRNVTFRTTSAQTSRAPRTVRFTLSDGGGGTSDPVTETIHIDLRGAPTVTAVFLDSTLWNPNFRQHLQDTGQGSAALGFAVPGGEAQLDEMPWINVDRVHVTFSEDVSVQANDLLVRGVNVPDYPILDFSYDAATQRASWTLQSAVAADRILLDLDGQPGTGGVSDFGAGTPLALDGAWNNGADNFPSGNGSGNASDFRFQVNALPGDVNRAQPVVNSLDVQQVRLRQFTSPASPGTPPNTYTAFHDVDGSAFINAIDVQQVRIRQFSQLPQANPALVAPASSLLAVTRAGRPRPADDLNSEG